MSRELERITSDTITALEEMIEGGVPSDWDFSYITHELLENHEKYGADKDMETVKEDMLGFPVLEGKAQVHWCFYGHHLVKKGAWWHWQNGNPNNGCDAQAHTCRPNHYWRYKITQSKPIRCARPARNPAFCGN